MGPLRVNFSLEGRILATEIEYRPLGDDCALLGINFWRLWVDCEPLGVDLGPL